MSIFRTSDVKCPSCGASVSFSLVHSVNADRRPDLRDAILNRSFQKESCPACGYAFRMEPEFSYLDMGRGLFIAAWPSDKVLHCDEYEALSRDAFDKAYGKDAPPEAQDIGKQLTPRVVFGWIGVNEKIIAGDAGLDDVTLELAKLAIIRSSEESPVGNGTELRLLGVEKDSLVLGWFPVGSEDLSEVISVSKDILTEIEKDAEKWKPLRDELSGSLFVDYRRFFIDQAVAG